MNGKRARRLRNEARAETIGAPGRLLGRVQQRTNKTKIVKGTEFPVFAEAVVNHPASTRGAYLNKKERK